MREQLSLLDAPRPPASLPGGEIQVRITKRAHVCVVCGNPVLIGNRAEVWPDGAAHIECGIRERWARK